MATTGTPAATRRSIERLMRAQAEDLLELAGIPHSYTPTPVRRYAKLRGRTRQVLVQRVADLHALPLMREIIAEKAQWYPKKGKGFLIDERKARFKRWYRDRLGPGPAVYMFWQGKRCLYVGRTEGGGGRPASHFDQHWFRKATRIVVLIPSHRRHVASLECLAMHLHDPLKNKARSSRKPYRSRCPVCVQTKRMLREFDALV